MPVKRGAPTHRVIYAVTDAVWRSSLPLRFQLAFYPRARSVRTGYGLVPSVAASRIHWHLERRSGDWCADVVEGSAADRHLMAILHGSFGADSLRRALVNETR